MGSLRPSMRSKVTSPAVPNGAAPHLEPDTLTEELRAFKKERFDADQYVQSHCETMSEKGIRALCSDLVRLKKASAEEMRRSVYANYAAFIRTSQEISDLEGELLAMRNLLSSQASLIHGLADGVRLDSLPDHTNTAATEEASFPDDNGQVYSKDEMRLHMVPDTLDVLIAERRVDEALTTLFEGESIVANLSGREPPGQASALQGLLSERRARLRDQLVRVAKQPSTQGRELCVAILALYRLGDGPCAHTLLLSAHSQRLLNNVQELRASGATYGGAYMAALSQLVFSTISQAAKDSQSIFGEQAAYASELVLWASDEATTFASLVKRHVLSSAAAAGGLRAAADCLQVALGYCSLLEQQGLALCPTLLKLFRPDVEQALQANLRHIEESVSVLAAADDWVVYPASGPARSGSRGGSSVMQVKLSNSAHRLQALMQDFVDDVAPLLNLQLGALVLDGLVQVFESYVIQLMMAVPGPLDDSLAAQMDQKIVKLAETESQQLGLLANSSALADDVLPRAAAKLLSTQSSSGREELRKRASERTTASQSRTPELREWRRRWQRVVDKLRDHYCRNQVLELMFTEDEETNFSVYFYLNLDNDEANLEPLPSPIFQQLFYKLNKLSHVAAEVMAGRERMTAMLLMRLVDTFVIFISQAQDFWDELEVGQRALGQAGLQQFVLDMQFLMQVASHGRFLSRQIKAVVADIITRAMEAFGRTGLDPNSALPDNEWFLAAAQDSLQKLLAEWSRGDLLSPTASVSAHSMSSTRSHGSP